MPDRVDGNSAQIRAIAEQIARAAVIEVRAQEADENLKLTPAVKWMAGVASVLVTLFCAWSVSTLNKVQLDVAAITAQLGPGGVVEARFAEANRRMQRLERLHDQGRRQGE